MNSIFLEAAVGLGLGSGATVLATALAARCCRGAVAQRTLWQACLLGLAGLLACELTGILDWGARNASHGARSATDRTTHPEAESLSLDEASLTPERIDALLADGVGAEMPELKTADEGAVAVEGMRGRETASGSSLPWLPAVWISGLVVVLARVLFSRGLLVIFRRKHPLTNDCALLDRVHALARRLGWRRRVCVLDAVGLASPVAFGVLRPTLALPAGFTTEFDVGQQEVILAHELAHLAAGDPAWHLFVDLLSAALWWHPLVWWARSQVRHASEAAADEASLLLADGPGTLAACLVEFGTRLLQRGQPGWVRMAGSGFRSSLGRRVERLLRLHDTAWRPPSRRRVWLTLTFGSTALAVTAFLCTVAARPAASREGDSTMPTLQQSWRRSLAGLVVLSALATSDPGQALAQDAPASEKAASQTAKDGSPQGISLLHIKGSVDGLAQMPILGRLFEGNEVEPNELVVRWDQKNIRIPFRVDEARKKDIKEIWLHVESDGGPPWDQPANGKEYFDVKLPSANKFWFRVTLEDQDGKRTKPGGPLLQVRVDDPPQGPGKAPPPRNETEADLQREIKALEDQLRVLIEKKQGLSEEPQRLREITARGDEEPAVSAKLKELKALVEKENRLEAERAKLGDAVKDLNAKRTKVFVFRLKHADANALRDTLYTLLGGTTPVPPGGMGMPGRMPGSGMGPPGSSGGPAGMMAPGAPPGMGGGAPRGGEKAGAAPSWRIAADPATHSLIIRGTERDVKVASDLVAALDVARDAAIPSVGSFTVIRLKHRNVEEVAGVLKELEVDVRLVSDSRSNTLLVNGSDTAVKEMKELLTTLDVPVPEKEDRKPHGGSGGPGRP